MAHHGPPRYRVVLCGNYGVGKTTLFQRFVVDALDNNVGPTTIEESLPQPHSDQHVTSLVPSNARKKRSRGDLRQCVGIDTFCRQFVVPDGRVVQLELCDTGGMERYNTLSVGYFARASAVIVCYSLIDRNSFSAVASHIIEAVENAYRRAGGASITSQPGRRSVRSPVVVFLCGTKSDRSMIDDNEISEEISMKRAVTRQMIETLLSEFESVVVRSFTVSARTGRSVTSMFEDIASLLVEEDDTDRKRPTNTNRSCRLINRHDSQTSQNKATSSGGDGKRIWLTANVDSTSKQLHSCCRH